MQIIDIFEENNRRVVVTYPGRFQPFHKGHAAVFRELQSQFGSDNVFIVTSNKTDANKSPFNFSDKSQFMAAAGVPAHSIIEASQVYDLPSQFDSDKQNIVFISVVGAPDAARLSPGAIKKDGSPSYFQKWESMDRAQSADQHGYVIIASEKPQAIQLGGKKHDVSHGTPTRRLWNEVRGDEQLKKEFIEQLYGQYSLELEHILNKIPAPTTAIAEEAAGVGVVKNGNDPRYMTSTMGVDNDVDEKTLGKIMKAYHLAGKNPANTRQIPVKEAEGIDNLGYDAQSLIMKLRRDVEEKRLQPTRQAVLSAARELAGDMNFAPELLVRQVLGQGVAEGMDQIIKIMFTPDDIEVVERAAGVMPTAKILPNIIDQYEKIAGIDREGDATLTLDLSVDDVSAIGLLVEKYGRRFDQTGIFHHIIDELERQGVAEAFGPLPKDNQQIRLGRHTVDIERVGQDKDYIGFAWHDSQGKEHYEEVPVGDLGSYDDLIDRIKQEISHQERQYTDQGVAEGYGNHPSQRVDPRTGKRYVPPKSPLGQAVAEVSGGAQYKIKSVGRDSKGDYYVSPSTGEKVYKSGVKRGDHENPKTGEHKSVAETALKDKEDLAAKRQALQDLSRNPSVDQKAVQQRLLDLEKEAKSRGLAEGIDQEFDMRLAKILKQRGYKGPVKLEQLGMKWVEAIGDVVDIDDYTMVQGNDPEYSSWASYVYNIGKYAYGAEQGYTTGTAKQVEIDTRDGQGVAEAFGPLPKDNQQIRLGRHTVDIERVGLDKNYIGFAWHDSQGKEHYEEVPVDDLGSYDDLIDRIKQEISHQERQYTDQGVAESGLQYHTGVKKHGKEYMLKAAEAGRKGATQAELGALRDKYSKAYKKKTVTEDSKQQKAIEYVKLLHNMGYTPEEISSRIVIPISAVLEHLDTRRKLDEKCWDTYKQVGMKKKGNRMVPNCVAKEDAVPLSGHENAVESSIVRRIMRQHLDVLSKYGPDAVMSAAKETAERVGDVDEIGSSDVSAWTRETIKALESHDMDESMFSYDQQDPFNSEFAPDVGMGRNTLRGWKQSLARRLQQLSDYAQQATESGNIDKADMWGRIYVKMQNLNLEPIAKEIELAHAELEKVRRQGGVRSRAFRDKQEQVQSLEENWKKKLSALGLAGAIGMSAAAPAQADSWDDIMEPVNRAHQVHRDIGNKARDLDLGVSKQVDRVGRDLEKIPFFGVDKFGRQIRGNEPTPLIDKTPGADERAERTKELNRQLERERAARKAAGQFEHRKNTGK